MQNENHPTPLESRLLAEMAELDRKMGELLTERDSIRRILSRVRAESMVNVDVTRKNSYGRIVIEHRLIEVLKNAAKPLTTRRLSAEAKSVVYGLKDNTFRSYIYRMKARGLIVSPKTGVWTLPAPSPK